VSKDAVEKPKEVKQVVTKDVAACPRCSKEHEGMVFKPLARPFGRANFWATCPTTKEPVMATVTVDLEYVPEEGKKDAASDGS